MNKPMVMKLAGLVLLGIGIASVCAAVVPVTPEIDAATGTNALALLAGAVMIIRSKKR
jgi:hypothetical protein